MRLEDILTPGRCHCRMDWASKKRVLSSISELLAGQSETLNTGAVYNALTAREQLGSTGLGKGIAIPHCRVPLCAGIVGSLITLDAAVDFDAIDGRPVDVLFVLIVPERKADAHVRALSMLAELFQNDGFCGGLRRAGGREELYHAATGS